MKSLDKWLRTGRSKERDTLCTDNVTQRRSYRRGATITLPGKKAARGAKEVGSPSEVFTTLSFHSGGTGNQSGPQPGMKEARQALERLDDLLQRIRLAQEYL